jgi:SAM-dependent methyltransferase
MELPTVPFFGRTLDEYTRFLALDLPALRGRAVLDVAAGPSSFTVEASRRGIDAVAVDPLYDRPVHALAAQVRDDYEWMLTQMRAKPRLFRVGGPGASSVNQRPLNRNPRHFPAAVPHALPKRSRPYFPSFEAAETDRRAAASRFLADYEGNVRHGRYVRGAVPLLPFLDGSFDLVLCAHLLFLHAARFDFAWHVEACVELARVSAGEVRIHPVCGVDGRPYTELDRLRTELDARGITSEIRKVNYEFFVGSSSMLVLKPQSP